MDTKILRTLEEIRIYSDPYRMDIMGEFQKIDRPATIKEIADIMGEVPAKVYYHAKKLISIDLLTLDHTKQINGITAKYYQPFQGGVSIVRSEIHHSEQHVFLSEAQKLLEDIYTKSKNKFISLSNIDNPYGKLENSEVYLTSEEAKEFFEWINQFHMKHHKKDAHKEQEKYDVFTSIVKIPAEDKNKPS
ncbi:winged helix-turn-helix domain-containing protein [Paenibacillus sp. IHBB 10380]|uniref:winged helix-turn-helix domain-containing protein n=1 Tax=Paenibacillus sp. IHBB 10380 TaxID=1566358 RepID=UPI0005CFE529|nr:helix-turn-helix domain-containing protein [Paenibacillus sp. IHBB 10380]AJS59255.1 hypothetical protein UB51_13155 [Paenibacillus sp. IHBB 10380]